MWRRPSRCAAGLAKRLDDADERVRAAAEPILTRLAEMLDDEGARARPYGPWGA